ncbi:MAG: YgjP-like metallopeptidase domain-containing protein, partial [Chloroflexota bacterium]|nr:YgjP-like metallopeptidase domain-containing protein [Chloroflexota bacterium]
MTKAWTMPEYSVRESKRARQVIIKISSSMGLEVVVPVKFSRSEIPAILWAKARWIEKTLAQTRPAEELKRPESITFGLLDENWKAEYSPSQTQRIRLFEKAGNVLLLTGPVEDPVAVVETLNRWVQKRAKEVLVPWLGRLSSELSLPFSRVSVRRQRTKWGSCSAE